MQFVTSKHDDETAERWVGRLRTGLLAIGLLFGSGVLLAGENQEDGSGLEKKLPGLRFNSGPVCMCSGGLSEADIRRAERERSGLPDKESKKRILQEEE